MNKIGDVKFHSSYVIDLNKITIINLYNLI